MRVVNVAVIGCGYWGPNYIRILNELEESKVISCCDLEENNLAKIKRMYHSHITLVKDYKKIALNPGIEAVIITTPLRSHFEIAKLFLGYGKHVLVEKPFTFNSREADELKKIAEKKRLVLMVGHVYKFNPGVQKLRKLIQQKQFGCIYYINAQREGLGPIRKQANVLWDLATHDISIALYLLNDYPEKITAVGEYYIQKGIKDVVFLSLNFPSRIVYNIYASWFAPEKIRKTTVVGSKCMAVFDDVNKMETVKLYKREVDKNLLDSTPEYDDHQLVVKAGDVLIPQVEQSEPLKGEVKHYLECIVEHKKPLTDAADGLKVVKILEAAEKSLRYKGTVRCR